MILKDKGGTVRESIHQRLRRESFIFFLDTACRAGVILFAFIPVVVSLVIRSLGCHIVVSSIIYIFFNIYIRKDQTSIELIGESGTALRGEISHHHSSNRGGHACVINGNMAWSSSWTNDGCGMVVGIEFFADFYGLEESKRLAVGCIEILGQLRDRLQPANVSKYEFWLSECNSLLLLTSRGDFIRPCHYCFLRTQSSHGKSLVIHPTAYDPFCFFFA